MDYDYVVRRGLRKTREVFSGEGMTMEFRLRFGGKKVTSTRVNP